MRDPLARLLPVLCRAGLTCVCVATIFILPAASVSAGEAPVPSSLETLLPAGALWEYTFTDPTSDPSWNTTTGTGAPWVFGLAPFGTVGSGDFGFNTFWPPNANLDDDLWLRYSLELPATVNLATVRWDLGVDNGFKLYANGVLIDSDNAEAFTFRWEYSGGFGTALHHGTNVIAVAAEDHGGETAFDMQITAELVPEPSSLLLAAIAGPIGFRVARRSRRMRRGV